MFSVKNSLSLWLCGLGLFLAMPATAYEFIHPKRSKCLEPAASAAILTLQDADFHLVRDGQTQLVAALVNLENAERFDLRHVIRGDEATELILFQSQERLVSLVAKIGIDGSCLLADVEYRKIKSEGE